MNPSEKLKEIETWYCNRSDDQVKWLIARVKKLTEALDGIKWGQHCSACSCNCHNTAGKALEDE